MGFHHYGFPGDSCRIFLVETGVFCIFLSAKNADGGECHVPRHRISRDEFSVCPDVDLLSSKQLQQLVEYLTLAETAQYDPAPEREGEIAV